jgi:AbrB family looped-hinge helix DNA binding protein
LVSQRGELMAEAMKGKVLGTVTVGERGQVVIPAEIRKMFKISPGDKLIVFAKPDMIGLIPAEDFNRFLEQATELMAKMKK